MAAHQQRASYNASKGTATSPVEAEAEAEAEAGVHRGVAKDAAAEAAVEVAAPGTARRQAPRTTVNGKILAVLESGADGSVMNYEVITDDTDGDTTIS